MQRYLRGANFLLKYPPPLKAKHTKPFSFTFQISILGPAAGARSLYEALLESQRGGGIFVVLVAIFRFAPPSFY